MGYFSNGSEASEYQHKWCRRCSHDINSDCPVYLAHLLWNYDECNNKNSVLHKMIPREGIGNGKCFAFKEK